jgi:hypothetical protein
MTRSTRKIHFPTPRLATLAARPGGISREHALEHATQNIQDMRAVGIDAIESSMKRIESVVYGIKDNRLQKREMIEVLREADCVVTIAATFGLASLENVSKCLCDLADGLLARDLPDAAPILVHVQALRLTMPGSDPVGEEEMARIVEQLARVRSHYKIVPLSTPVQASVQQSHAA